MVNDVQHHRRLDHVLDRLHFALDHARQDLGGLDAACLGVQMRTLFPGNHDIGVGDDGGIHIGVEVVRDANRERGSHRLPYPAHDLRIAAGITIHDHSAVEHQQHAVIRGAFLQALNDPADHGVKAPIVDRAPGNRVEEVNRI